MEPIAIEVRRNGEWALVHRCERCGALGNNRIASDDNEFVLMQLAARPIAFPAFPLEPLAHDATAPDGRVDPVHAPPYDEPGSRARSGGRRRRRR